MVPLTFLSFYYSRYLCVVKILENMPAAGEETRDKMSRCAYYLSLLLKLAGQKTVSRKCELGALFAAFVSLQSSWINGILVSHAVSQEEGCPRIVQSKLLRTFTVDTFNNGR